MDHQLVFVGGLHRSGTSLLHRLLSSHPDVSGFHDTGVEEDEGQHLQSVFPTARAHGGPGRFAFDPASHLTESSPLVTDANRQRLWQQWSAHWRMEAGVLVEKSPPNLVRMRFLQAMFPDAAFVMMTRHPVAVALATRKWARRSWLGRLVAHNLRAYEIMRADLPHVRSAMVVRYEDLLTDPRDVLDEVCSFVGLSGAGAIDVGGVDADGNLRYRQAWRQRARLERELVRRLYGRRLAEAGYPLDAL